MSSTQPDQRFLIVVLVFGIAATAAGGYWLKSGSIEIRTKRTRVGVGSSGPTPPATRQHKGPVMGRIEAADLAFYPLCLTWLVLGLSMIVLPVAAYVSRNLLFFRLAAFTCAAILLLGLTTVALAAWYGP
jgi:hypothetical protein